MQKRKPLAPKPETGRPPHSPTKEQRQMVEILVGFGIPQERIALALGINPNTLAKHYSDEIQGGAAIVEAQLARNLLRLASGDDGTALKAIQFALCCRFGWSTFQALRPAAEPVLGKKEAAIQRAQVAHLDSDKWANLVN